MTFNRGFLWLYFISAHFLGQEYGLMSPDDLHVIKCTGSCGQHYTVQSVIFLIMLSIAIILKLLAQPIDMPRPSGQPRDHRLKLKKNAN